MELILGPPGTGKTTTLLEIVDMAFKHDIEPNKIGYFSFTRQAAGEAKDRAIEKFGLTATDLPFFRTLHSLAFQELGLTKGSVLQKKHFKEIGELVGLEVTGFLSTDEGSFTSKNNDDIYPFIEQLARVKGTTLEFQFAKFHFENISLLKLKQYAQTLKDYKIKNYLYDFTDMITRYLTQCHAPQFDILLIDEAQDLSKIQWDMVHMLAKNSAKTIIAGDDDQAIFQWNGADVDQFIKLKAPARVLEKSYRLPYPIYSKAIDIRSRIKRKRKKVFTHADGEGHVSYCADINDIDFEDGEWLILARNNHTLKLAKDMLVDHGLNYVQKGKLGVDEKLYQAAKDWTNQKITDDVEKYVGRKEIDYSETHVTKWYDAFDRASYLSKYYIRRVLERGDSITQPRIELSTIHGAKGKERENVVLFTDISKRTWENLERNPDEEHRVFYVGVTRAKKRLFIISPKTKYHFDI